MTVDKQDTPLPGMPKKKRSKSARLGYDGERAVEVYLKEHGFKGISRPRAGQRDDAGDIAGLPLTVQVKNWAKVDLAGWIAGVTKQRAANGHAVGVVWHKRRGKGSAGEWYVTMTGDSFLHLLTAYREAGHDNRPA